jgi:6-phosphogluconolactonase
MFESWTGEYRIACASVSQTVRVYVGTYTSGSSRGIYRLRFDLETGTLTPEGSPAETVNPSFLALHPGGRFLYAVSETGDTPQETTGRVTAFAVDAATGALTALNDQPSRGAAPCHLSLDEDGRHVLVANYTSGTIAVLPIAPDGRLQPASAFVPHAGRGPRADRQAGPHAHWIGLDPAGRFALVTDLGADKVFVYRYDAVQGTLAPHDPPAVPLPPGSGPRHVAFHPNERIVYVLNELAATMTSFRYDGAAGTLTPVASAPTLPNDFQDDNLTAEVVVHPDGRFLYGSNRGHDSLAIFAVDGASGSLTPAGHQKTLGKTPRNFVVDPTGAFLLVANQGSDTVVVFRIDPATGGLTPVGEPAKVPTPVCLRIARRAR